MGEQPDPRRKAAIALARDHAYTVDECEQVLMVLDGADLPTQALSYAGANNLNPVAAAKFIRRILGA